MTKISIFTLGFIVSAAFAFPAHAQQADTSSQMRTETPAKPTPETLPDVDQKPTSDTEKKSAKKTAPVKDMDNFFKGIEDDVQSGQGGTCSPKPVPVA